MAVLSEITELLKRWDVWKRIEATPERLDHLEKKVEELEKRLARAPGEACPRCGALEFRVESVTADPQFGVVGGKRRHMKCMACGYKEDKLVT